MPARRSRKTRPYEVDHRAFELILLSRLLYQWRSMWDVWKIIQILLCFLESGDFETWRNAKKIGTKKCVYVTLFCCRLFNLISPRSIYIHIKKSVFFMSSFLEIGSANWADIWHTGSLIASARHRPGLAVTLQSLLLKTAKINYMDWVA